MKIPNKGKPGRRAKYGLRPGEDKRFVRCSKSRLETVRIGWLQNARLAGTRITTRAVKGGLEVYRVEGAVTTPNQKEQQ